tara:strand:- start:16117 stop:16377 length:261 start_codon:yes stop_codon:yes gene_type:complete
MIPFKKYHLCIYGVGSQYNDPNVKLSNLPTMDSTLFTDFYFWNIISSLNSSVTQFPVFNVVGGVNLSSPPVVTWINLIEQTKRIVS